MKNNILKNFSIENNFNIENNEKTGNISIRDLLDKRTYASASSNFHLQISYCDYWDVLCLYFHCNIVFEKHYRVNVIEKFKFLFERFLALYLMGIVPKNHQRRLIHFLIEILLHRLIDLPNPTSSLCVNDKIRLLLYYYLCKDEKKISKLLFNLRNSVEYLGHDYKNESSLICFRAFFPSSILSNDIILTKYMEKHFRNPSMLTSRFIYFTPLFLFHYIEIRVAISRVSSKEVIKEMLKIFSWLYRERHEIGLLNVLKENLGIDI